mgnify:CR=1 FL=1
MKNTLIGKIGLLVNILTLAGVIFIIGQKVYADKKEEEIVIV